MNASKIIAAAALAVASSLAAAGPVQIGTGTGTFTFTGTKDGAFFVTLGPGTYDFSSSISATGSLELVSVYLASAKNPLAHNTIDYSQYTEVSSQLFTDAYGPLVLTQTSDIYVDVNSRLGKLAQGAYSGTLTVSAVPEPASVAMLFAGLGLFGFMGRRRRG